MNTSLILTLDLALAVLLLWCLAKLGASGRTVGLVGAACAVWLSLHVWMFGGRRIIPADIGGLAFFAILLAGVALVAVLFFTTPIGESFRRGGQEWLLMPQSLRAFFGTAFLIQGVGGTLPPAFAIADGVTHIAAAVLALWTAWTVGKGYCGARALWVANLLGEQRERWRKRDDRSARSEAVHLQERISMRRLVPRREEESEIAASAVRSLLPSVPAPRATPNDPPATPAPSGRGSAERSAFISV